MAQLDLKYLSGADTVSFLWETSEDDRVADFDLKLMQIESRHMDVFDQQYSNCEVAIY